MNPVVFAGFGSNIPARRTTNQDWEALVETSDEWIRQNLGIRERSRIGPAETTTTMGAAAARIALTQAGAAAAEIDFILCATNSQDDLYPSTASKIQAELAIPDATAFDVQAGCTGWLYAMRLATALVQAGQARAALVIGSDALSRALNYHDRSTMLFGDGAGAALVRAPIATGPTAERIPARLPAPIFFTHNEPSMAMRQPTIYREEFNRLEDVRAGQEMSRVERPLPHMNGKQSLKLALVNTKRAIDAVLAEARARHGIDHFDVFVPHQTNIHIIKALCDHAGVAFERIPFTLEKYGGISTAGIPTGLYEHQLAGQIKPGDLVLCCGYGAGFTSGAMLFEWTAA